MIERSRLIPTSGEARWSLLVGLDGAAWLATLGAATAVRLSIADTEVQWGQLVLLALVALISTWAIRQNPRTQTGRSRRGSISDAKATTAVWAAVSVVVMVANYVALGRPVPTGAVALALPLALVLQLGIRLSWRAVYDNYRRPGLDDSKQRVIVFGAGEGGEQIIRAMQRDPRIGICAGCGPGRPAWQGGHPRCAPPG